MFRCIHDVYIGVHMVIKVCIKGMLYDGFTYRDALVTDQVEPGDAGQEGEEDKRHVPLWKDVFLRHEEDDHTRPTPDSEGYLVNRLFKGVY